MINWKWLYPGMQVKRWILLLMVGVTVISLGVAYFLRDVYTVYTFPDWVYYATLQFLDRSVRGAIFLIVGVATIVVSLAKLNHSIVSVLLPPDTDDSLADRVHRHRIIKRGPKIVTIGGGTGMSMLLRGLKQYTGNLTAIVTVADDGGSSGRLRRELGILPPGDFRNCIAALADAEPLMTELLQYRFRVGDGLEGHSFGNLFLVAMSEVTGNFEEALRETSRVLAVRGQILPSTLANVVLGAELAHGETVTGESRIGDSTNPIRRVWIEPEDSVAYPESVRAILEADMVVLGPGSLFTSVLPNLLVDGIRKALRASSAVRVYVCNVATQPGETAGFRVEDHVTALWEHVGQDLFDYVLANNVIDYNFPETSKSEVVTLGDANLSGVKIVLSDVVDPNRRLRHDPKKLAESLMRLYYDRLQFRSEPAVDRQKAEAAAAR
ncbi:MAG TPA: gluconeogenesis factor YvcK family protein [Dehalococcoidia bacterium]|nr:gluconeogenesis factor YvcK family protein [Dehalococcoidia bacterium]